MLDSANPGSADGGRKRRRSLRGEVGQTGARFGSPALRRTLEEDVEVEAPVEEPKPAPKPRRGRRSLRGEVGATGARFGSPALRRSLDNEADAAERAHHAEEETGPETERLARVEETAPFFGEFDDEELIPEEPYYEESRQSLVRPYAWTGGRTTSNFDLRLETLISVDESGIHTAMRSTSPEQRSIVEMCMSPRSVAEVSAVLSVPLGVARVLLSDLIEMGVVSLHDTNGGAVGAQPDLMLLERVLAGLRRL
jgi:hypothetical protein